jgi:hypothetical protein
MALLSKIGKGIASSKGIGSGKGMGVLLGGALLAGGASKAGRAAVETVNEAATGDPNTDRYFMGSQGLSPSGLADAATGSGAAAVGTVGGAGIGAIFGGIGAFGLAGAAKELKPDSALKIGGKTLIHGADKKFNPLVRGMKSMSRGSLIMGGIAAGAAIGASAMTKGYVNRNQQFFKESPYTKGSAMQASSTQAYGDMVLGMHNSRRG